MEIDSDVLKKFKAFLITLIICLVSLPSFCSFQFVYYYLPPNCSGSFTVPFYIFCWGFFSPSYYVGFGRAYYSEYDSYCGGWISASFPGVIFFFILSIGIAAVSLIIFIRVLVLLNSKPERWNSWVKPAGIYSLVVGIVADVLSIFDGLPLPNSLNGIIMIIFGGIILGVYHKVAPQPENDLWSSSLQHAPYFNAEPVHQPAQGGLSFGPIDAINSMERETKRPQLTSNQIYQFVVNFEKFLRSNTGAAEPSKVARDLGFTDSRILCAFIATLNRDDLIRFDEGKIVVGKDMFPGEMVDLLQKLGNYLKNIKPNQVGEA